MRVLPVDRQPDCCRTSLEPDARVHAVSVEAHQRLGCFLQAASEARTFRQLQANLGREQIVGGDLSAQRHQQLAGCDELCESVVAARRIEEP